MPDLLHTIASILDPKAWDGEDRPNIRLRTQVRHRQTSSMNRARKIIRAVASHFNAMEGGRTDA